MTKITYDKTSPDYKLVMKSARHLSAHRMGANANGITSGIDWTGSKKSNIALELLNGQEHLHSAYPATYLVYRFETHANTRGEMALTEQSLPAARVEIADLRVEIASMEKKSAAWHAKRPGKTTFKWASLITFRSARVLSLEAAIRDIGGDRTFNVKRFEAAVVELAAAGDLLNLDLSDTLAAIAAATDAL